MEIISYFKCDRRQHWLAEIGKSDWDAGALLYDIICTGTFGEMLGAGSELLLLTDGDRLVSYCTFAEKDDIQPTTLTPWVGFVYTFPEYRGKHAFGILLKYIEKLARERGIPELHISTNHIGLYEKYGFEFSTLLNDIHGEPSRVYVKRLK